VSFFFAYFSHSLFCFVIFLLFSAAAAVSPSCADCSYVQETVLFNDTIGYNIAYGKAGGNASQEEIVEAAKKV
jgi:ABC-type multidrug transport system fused ATPase/permease subunit